jgi:hypothetical protein
LTTAKKYNYNSYILSTLNALGNTYSVSQSNEVQYLN